MTSACSRGDILSDDSIQKPVSVRLSSFVFHALFPVGYVAVAVAQAVELFFHRLSAYFVRDLAEVPDARATECVIEVNVPVSAFVPELFSAPFSDRIVGADYSMLDCCERRDYLKRRAWRPAFARELCVVYFYGVFGRGVNYSRAIQFAEVFSPFGLFRDFALQFSLLCRRSPAFVREGRLGAVKRHNDRERRGAERDFSQFFQIYDRLSKICVYIKKSAAAHGEAREFFIVL